MQPFFASVFAAGENNHPAPLPVTFDDALEAIQQLPQMFAEPDGSFVWASPRGVEPRWQVDGVLVDGGETLFYVELKGTCPTDEIDSLLKCFRVGRTSLVMVSVDEGTQMSEEAFRHSFTSLPNTPAPAPDRPG